MNDHDLLGRLRHVLEVLSDISAEATDADDLMQRMVRVAMRFTGGTGAAVAQLDDSDQVFVATGGVLADRVGFRVPRAGSLWDLAIATGQIQRCDDSDTDARINRDSARTLGLRSLLVMPLLFGDEVLGTLLVTSEQPSAFQPMDQQLLQYSAGIIGAALGRELRHADERRKRAVLRGELDASRVAERKFRQQASIDPLTGLANRRQFERWLAEALTGDGARTAGSMALLFLDVDAFKALNDRHGHAAGDAALVRIAELLRTIAPEGYRFARLAGDEFVVLATGLQQAAEELEAFAHQLCVESAKPQLLAPGIEEPIAISIGAAIHDGSALDRKEWLRRADKAMYAAKGDDDTHYRLYRHRR
ncbi:MAG: sensor domain-containing diguanylate cyclase [Luteimonas sp.]